MAWTLRPGAESAARNGSLVVIADGAGAKETLEAPLASHRVTFDAAPGDLKLTLTVRDERGVTIDEDIRQVAVPDLALMLACTREPAEEWGNTTLFGTYDADAIRRLKDERPGTIYISGSGQLVLGAARGRTRRRAAPVRLPDRARRGREVLARRRGPDQARAARPRRLRQRRRPPVPRTASVTRVVLDRPSPNRGSGPLRRSTLRAGDARRKGGRAMRRTTRALLALSAVERSRQRLRRGSCRRRRRRRRGQPSEVPTDLADTGNFTDPDRQGPVEIEGAEAAASSRSFVHRCSRPWTRARSTTPTRTRSRPRGQPVADPVRLRRGGQARWSSAPDLAMDLGTPNTTSPSGRSRSATA